MLHALIKGGLRCFVTVGKSLLCMTNTSKKCILRAMMHASSNSAALEGCSCSKKYQMSFMLIWQSAMSRWRLSCRGQPAMVLCPFPDSNHNLGLSAFSSDSSLSTPASN